MVFCTPFGVKIETDTIKRGSFNINGFVHTEAGLIQEKSDISCDRHHTDSSMGSFLLTKWMATYSTMHLGQLGDHNIRLIFPSQSYQQWLPTLISVKELEDLQSWQCDIQCHCHPKWKQMADYPFCQNNRTIGIWYSESMSNGKIQEGYIIKTDCFIYQQQVR